MAQNFLYMFEFVVDDLLITHPNECAPDEYLTCCELTFRSSVFVNICDPEFGGCLDSCTPTKSGKCCLFGLETPITKDDKLFVHIYKKKIEKCKFLLGTTEVPVKNIFEKTTADFLEDNPCLVAYEKQINKTPSETLSKKSVSSKNKNVYDSSGNNDKIPRTEEFCPSSTIEKKLLSLFDLKGKQTGNVVLIIRLSCMGPTIVSPFPFCKSNKYKPCPKPPPDCCEENSKNCQYTPRCKPCPCPPQPPCCPSRPPPPSNSCSPTRPPPPSNSCCPPSPPCCPPPPRCPAPKKCCALCPGDEEEEEGEGECSSCSEAPCYYPCVVNPTVKPPTTDEYDEFEANLNGSGMVVRVLKNSHYIQNIVDSDYESDGDECCGGKKENNSDNHQQVCCGKGFQKSSFLSTSFKKSTGGKYLNEKDLPKIRGNVKYPSNELCQNFELPVPIIKECDGTTDKIDKYRKCCPENRNICMQVIGPDIDKALKGINTTNKNGIEICHEKCQETDSDVFILKLGKKQKCKNKQNVIEIELKTPKCPIIINRPKCTRESQIDEVELDSELKNICGKKKKGKKK